MENGQQIPLFCEVCHKKFSGPFPAQQHFMSEDHKRRANSVSNLSAFDCDVCHVKCNSVKQHNEHNASPAHLDRLKRREEQQIVCFPVVEHPTSSSKPYDFDGSRGFCYICNIELTSVQHAQQHLTGTKHNKKQLQNNINYINELSCFLCKVQFSSAKNAHEHFMSAKHIKKAVEAKVPYVQNAGNVCQQNSVSVQTAVPGMSLITGLIPAEQHFTIEKHKKRSIFPQTDFTKDDNVAEKVNLKSAVTDLFPNRSFPEKENPLSNKETNKLLPGNNFIQKSPSSCQTLSDEDLCLKVDGGNITRAMPSVQHMFMTNNFNSKRDISALSDLQQSYSAANIGENCRDRSLYSESNENCICNETVCKIKHCVKDDVHPSSGTLANILISEPSVKQEYSFDGSRGFCNVCNIVLTSWSHAREHFQGKNHLKAKQIFFSEKETKIIEKNKNTWDYNKPEYKFNGTTGYCYVCNIDLTSRLHATQHINGKKHKKLAERKQQEKLGKTYPLFCEICLLQCSGQESAIQHFNSAKHLQKMTLTCDGIRSCKLVNTENNLKSSVPLFSSPITQVIADFKSEDLPPIQCDNTGIQSSDVLRTLRPPPSNLSSMSHPDGNQNPDTNNDNIGKTKNMTNYSNNKNRQEMVIPKITTSVLVPTTKAYTATSPSDSGNESKEEVTENGTKLNKYYVLKNRNCSGINLDENLYEHSMRSNLEPFSEKKSDCVEESDLISFESNCSEFLKTGNFPSDDVSDLAREDLKYYKDSTTETITFFERAEKPKINRFEGYFKFYCLLCDRPMNTEEAYKAHLKGKDHQKEIANTKAPERSLPDVRKTLTEDEAYDRAYDNLVKTNPRTYQVELFSKVMQSDSVIFLPTGTGKTLVAAMTISHMLEANPSRPVLFLVDKILLVIQQSKYLREQLSHKKFKRTLSPDNSNGEVGMRELKIASLSGGIAASEPTPLYHYDIIVAVAAYCFNLLSQKKLHWSDFSLVVFDEAHHCIKKHPFNNLLEIFHLPFNPTNRPKLLGLTASPAGKETFELTYKMLQELLYNLGSAKVQIVETKPAKEQLAKHQSNALLHIKYEPRTDEEEDFRQQLMVYLVNCYLKLNEISNIDKECYFMNFFKPKLVSGMTEETLLRCAEELNDPDRIKLFMHVLGLLKPKSEDTAIKANLDFLRNHTLIMMMSLQDMDGMGIPCSMEELRPLLNTKIIGNFEKASQLGLNCDKLNQTVKVWQDSALVTSEFEADGQRMSLIKLLLSTLQNKEYINWQNPKKPIALVLVRERVLAKRLSKFLKDIGFVKSQKLSVTAVVGHGSGTANHGMRVNEQKRVLDGINDRRYQIVIATSVAEEGVDIPVCELVICLNLPGTVTGLVQMRGRARKKDSHFVIICSSKKEEEQMKNLLKREKNMMIAAEQCVEQQKK